ncbi:MAG TPA: cation transporter [Microbacteriaceae bacterium]
MSSNPGPTRFSQRRRLAIVLTLNLALIGGLVAVGIAARSVGVLAAAGDTLADSVALALGLIAGALVLGLSAGREDIHMKSVLLDTLADAAAAAGVLVAGVVIWITGGTYWLDPAIALILAAVIGYAGTRLAVQAVAALRGADIDFDND